MFSHRDAETQRKLNLRDARAGVWQIPCYNFKSMQTLVLCDDYWHPARVPREGLSRFQDKGFTFDWIEDAREWSAERMEAYPLVILTKSNHVSSTDTTGWMIEEVESAFVEYVRKGNGLLAIHSGTADYQEKTILRSL